MKRAARVLFCLRWSGGTFGSLSGLFWKVHPVRPTRRMYVNKCLMPTARIMGGDCKSGWAGDNYDEAPCDMPLPARVMNGRSRSTDGAGVDQPFAGAGDE